MGKNLPAARFAVDEKPKIQGFIDGFDPPTRARYDAHVKAEDDIRGRRLVRNAKSDELARDIADAQTRLAHFVRDIERTGKDVGKEVRKPDGHGGETVEFVSVPAVASLEKTIIRQKSERNAIEKEKLPIGQLDRINEKLGDLRPDMEFVPAELPPVATPNAGETLTDVYAVELATLEMLAEEVDRFWVAPLPNADLKKWMRDQVDGIAKPPNFGGGRRNYSEDHRGKRRVKNPMARMGLARQTHGFFMTPAGGKLLETRDAIPTMFWLLGDQFKAACDKYIDERFPDDGTAIRAADKPGMIAKAERELWNQRRVVEETFLAATAVGFNVKRPAETPIEILLAVQPFGTRAPAPSDPPGGDHPAPVAPKAKPTAQSGGLMDPAVVAAIEKSANEEFEPDSESEFG